MKKIIKTILLPILIYFVLNMILANNSNAAIESKPGTTADTNKTQIQFFEYCYKMRNQNSSLGGNALDPHLATARDWGAVAYLGLSSYGTVRNSTGDVISINERDYYTTTGNISGVMNFGYDPDRTTNFDTYVALRTPRGYGIATIYDNYKKYIDYMTEHTNTSTKGMAMWETHQWNSSIYSTSNVGGNDTFVRRNGVLGSYSGGSGGGAATTYRPAIWN